MLGSAVGAAENLGLAAVHTARAGADAVVSTVEAGASATFRAVGNTAIAAATVTGERAYILHFLYYGANFFILVPPALISMQAPLWISLTPAAAAAAEERI
jgi:hypothetical protein